MNRPTPGAEERAGSPRNPVHGPAAQQDPSSGPAHSYVYVLGRAGTALETAAAQLTGVRDGSLRAVTAGRLAALVSSVPADAFSEEGMKAQLENLTELEEIARRHHAVVEAAGTHATVLPMRLATVYLDDARVRSMLEARGAEFDELLSLLEGHAEVGVKVYADARAAAKASPPDSPDPAASPVSPGRAYLQQRRARQRTHRDAYRAAGAVAEEVRVRASALARDRVVHRPQQGNSPPVRARTSPTRPIWSPRTASRNSTGRCPLRPTTSPAYVSRSPARGPRTPSRHRPRGKQECVSGGEVVSEEEAVREGVFVNGGDVVSGGDAYRAAFADASSPADLSEEESLAGRQVALIDLLDRLLNGGAVLTGDIVLSIADVDLVHINLRAVIRSIAPDSPAPW